MNSIYFSINTNKIRDIENKEILKDKSPNLSYFQKEFNFRKQEKTTTINEIPLQYKKKSINNDSNIYLNIKEKPKQKDVQNFIDNFNNKQVKEKEGKYFDIEPERSISTTCSSTLTNISELCCSNNYVLIKSQNLNASIDVNAIKMEDEREIREKMKNIKDPYLNDYQKRKIVLESSNTLTEDLRINRFDLDIDKMKKREEKFLNENIDNLNDNYHNNYEKRERTLKNNKTTTINLKNKDIELNQESENSNNNLNISNTNSFISLNETKEDTKAEISENTSSNQIEQNEEKTFNSTKEKYYEKKKLYDLILGEEIDENKNILIPDKYKIDKSFAFLYPNDINTNYITKSAFLGDKNSINKLSENDVNNCIYYYYIGQYFCDKEIQLEKENQKKRCRPNEFMCKSCMDLNKKKYNLKNNYLINIKGRVAKVNKGSYHCFGKFLCGNQIEDCISKFSCEACKMLDLYSSYYQ